MCIFDHPRVESITTTEVVSGKFVDVEHTECDFGRFRSVNWALGAYHALIAVAGCVTSYMARNVGSQCEPMRGAIIACDCTHEGKLQVRAALNGSERRGGLQQ